MLALERHILTYIDRQLWICAGAFECVDIHNFTFWRTYTWAKHNSECWTENLSGTILLRIFWLTLLKFKSLFKLCLAVCLQPKKCLEDQKVPGSKWPFRSRTYPSLLMAFRILWPSKRDLVYPFMWYGSLARAHFVKIFCAVR